MLDSHGAVETELPWASVTKPVTAWVVLMAVDQGIVGLDEPAGPPGSTVAHLLAHASGLPMNGDEPVTDPGQRRIYSNAGFETVAGFVAERTGIGFAELISENILEPLGMGASRLERASGAAENAAQSQASGAAESAAQSHGAAAGMTGSLADLLAFGRELLAPTLIGERLHAEATSVAFDGLSGVLPGFGRQEPNDWGLGVEIRDVKEPHWTGADNSPTTFGHFGQSGSFLWVDPEAGLACASLADRAFDDWARQAWPALSDDVLRTYS